MNIYKYSYSREIEYKSQGDLEYLCLKAKTNMF